MMTQKLNIALAQLNPTVGDLRGNLALALTAAKQAQGADIVVFSELFLTGYFPEDLLFKPQFLADADHALHQFCAQTEPSGATFILPTVRQEDGLLFNSVAVIQRGEIIAWRDKVELPNDDVFYEKRYFTPGMLPEPVKIKGIPIGVPICEDIWYRPVCAHLKKAGAQLLICPNGSPYWRNKQAVRYDLVRRRIKETGLVCIYLNQVGGQDELVFDGASFCMNTQGELVAQLPSFAAELQFCHWTKTKADWVCEQGNVVPLASVCGAPWHACVLGLKDYVHKNHFEKVVLGLSGGLDSAITAAMAVDAFGCENVHAVMMPYTYTAPESIADAQQCAKGLGIRYDVIPIHKMVQTTKDDLGPLLKGLEEDVTEENIQSRLRGVILMALSNKFGAMLLTTGNKSEIAVGYATLYGDMNGGFNPIKDLYKTQAYQLCAWRNQYRPAGCLGPETNVVPQNIIDKAPSAELRADQTDQDNLPAYDILDGILQGLVEDELSVSALVAKGYAPEMVKRINHLLHIAEYKRNQAPPGVKLTRKAFGSGRKYPITNGYRDQSAT